MRPPLTSLSDSELFGRIQDSGLKSIVESTARKSADLLSTVIREMPLFTLHNERHILNVIGWMEELLAPGELVEKMSQFECALCLLAAYTHDLGMTLSAKESVDLENDPDYQRHRDGFLDECILIESLRAKKEHGRAQLIEGHIRTDYLRVNHSNGTAKRLRARIGEVAPKLEYNGFDFRAELEWIAISHNQPAEWLRREFEKHQRPWRSTAGRDKVNFAFVGILLRLADILDFDASRTPRILFQHLGLDQHLGSRFEKISAGEWSKHLAITGIEVSPGNRITYTAASCPHPAVEKSIREFGAMIEREIRTAALELRYSVEAVPEDRERLRLQLPQGIDLKITAAIVDGLPCYEYHDWSFRLDQQEIMQLLMGESLYGDPSLCIRELLQNALDALELRDLRLQLKGEGVSPAEPVDGVSTRQGWFQHEGPAEARGRAWSNFELGQEG